MTYIDTVLNWLTTNSTPIAVFLVVLLAFYTLKAVIIGRLRTISEKTKNDFDDFFVEALKTLRFVFGATVALLVAVLVSGINPFESIGFAVLVVAVVTFQVTRSIGVIFNYLVKKISKEERTNASVQGLKTIINVFIWIIGALTIVSVLGYNINSLIAGLGIGGIAVALAVQNVLSDVFSSFAIFFDRPFAVGDYILVDDKEGTVVAIGMKSTRIQSLRGEEIVMSNRNLTDAVVQNFGKLERRRVVQDLGFEYGTTNDQLSSLPNALEEIVNSESKAEFERAFFNDFGNSALEIKLTYYVNSPDYDEFTQIKHRLNLAIKARIEKEGASLAFPTQTLHVIK